MIVSEAKVLFKIKQDISGRETISKQVFSAPCFFVFVDVDVVDVVLVVVAVDVVDVVAVVVVGFFVPLSANKSEIRFKGGSKAAALAATDFDKVQRRDGEKKFLGNFFKLMKGIHRYRYSIQLMEGNLETRPAKPNDLVKMPVEL